MRKKVETKVTKRPIVTRKLILPIVFRMSPKENGKSGKKIGAVIR